jgi:AcrR family transcriptional regulator
MSTAKRRQRERAQRRESILDAAEVVFYRKGYGPTRVEDVARQAQLSKGALYQYFASKDELLLAVTVRWRSELIERARQRLEHPASGAEHLRQIMELINDWLSQPPERFHLMMGVLAAHTHFDRETAVYQEAKQRGEELMRLIVEAIIRGQQDCSICRELKPLHLLLHFWGGVIGMLLIAMLAHIDPEAEADIFAGFELAELPSTFIDFFSDAIAPRDAGGGS